MEDPDRLQLFLSAEPPSLQGLLFNCVYDSVQASSDFMCNSNPKEGCLDVTYFALGEQRGYARIHNRAPARDDQVDAVICAFSCASSNHLMNSLVRANSVIDMATSNNNILVLLLEHRKLYEARRTDVISLDLYMAQHQRVGYRRFDISGNASMSSLILEVLTTVRRARIESTQSQTGGLPYLGVVSWISSVANPLLCRQDPPPSIEDGPTAASAAAAAAASTPRIDPAVMDAGQAMIRYGLQQTAATSPPTPPSPQSSPRAWLERLFTIGGTAKTE